MRLNPRIQSEDDLITYAIAMAKRRCCPPIPLTDVESAVLLGLSRQAVDQALQRAMGKLRRCMRRTGFDVPNTDPVDFHNRRAECHPVKRRPFAA